MGVGDDSGSQAIVNGQKSVGPENKAIVLRVVHAVVARPILAQHFQKSRCGASGSLLDLEEGAKDLDFFLAGVEHNV